MVFQPQNRDELTKAIQEMDMWTGKHRKHGHINDWDVSLVTDMSEMFGMFKGFSFNQPLNNWNVSNVTNMSGMFAGCTTFDQPLNSWNVSNVTNMSCMFRDCHLFDQPLNRWNVSNVTNMSNMFEDCRSFIRILPWNLNENVNNHNMFQGSRGSLMATRSPVEEHDRESIRRRNGHIAHSIIKRANHPNMMRMDNDRFSPIDAHEPDYTRRLMANVRQKSPVDKGNTTQRKRSRARSVSLSRKRAHRK